MSLRSRICDSVLLCASPLPHCICYLVSLSRVVADSSFLGFSTIFTNSYASPHAEQCSWLIDVIHYADAVPNIATVLSDAT